MNNVKTLKCVSELSGFTVGKSYDVLSSSNTLVSVLDDNLVVNEFDTVEGKNDFKNWFIAE